MFQNLIGKAWQGMARHIKAQSKVNKKWTPPPPLRRDRDPLWWPGEHSVSVGVEPVECNLHVVAELPGRHLRSGLSHQTDVYQQSHIKYWHWIIPWVPLSHQELVNQSWKAKAGVAIYHFYHYFFIRRCNFIYFWIAALSSIGWGEWTFIYKFKHPANTNSH